MKTVTVLCALGYVHGWLGAFMYEANRVELAVMSTITACLFLLVAFVIVALKSNA
jgi:hypothetical protein